MTQTLGSILPEAAARYGDATALVFEGHFLSFRELDRLTGRVARALTDAGLLPGDRLALYAENCVEWIAVYHGALRAGAVVIPANSMLTGPELAFVIRDSGARFLATSAAKAAALDHDIDGLGLRLKIAFGDIADSDWLSFDDFVASAPVPAKPVACDPDATSTIGYTSGTTGHPKGAMLSHRAIWLNTAMTATMHMRAPGERVVTALPCSHVYGNVVMNGALMRGMTLILMRRFDPREALDLIETHRASLFEGVPTMYFYMLAEPSLATTDLSSLTRCTVGGQTMPVSKMEDVQKAFGCPLVELWGMTEIAGLGTTHPVLGLGKLGSCGIALPYCETRIDDLVAPGNPAKSGEPGELQLRGPILMQGYFGNPTATAEAMTSDGWLRTGDIATKDEAGHITVVDRKKDMILTAGFNVYPAEIERVLAAHPAVAMVAVAALPDEEKGEIACAYIVSKAGAAASVDELLAFARTQLAAYKVPRKIKFVRDFPKTSSGKIKRRDLAEFATEL